MATTTTDPVSDFTHRHVTIENVRAHVDGAGPVFELDVSWNHSWRDAPNSLRANWDAAWVFAKVRMPHRHTLALKEHETGELERALRHADGSALRRLHERAVQTGAPDLGHQLKGEIVSVLEHAADHYTLHMQGTQRAAGAVPAHVEVVERDLTVRVHRNPQGKPHAIECTRMGNWLPLRLVPAAGAHTAPAGGVVQPSEDGMGVFLHRGPDNLGRGMVRFTGVQLACDHPGLAEGPFDVWFMGVEMVHVPAGAFALGDPHPRKPGGPVSCFYTKPADGKGQAGTWTMDSEGAIPVAAPGTPTAAPTLTWDNTGQHGDLADIPAAFPKGHAAFYCMKRKITQGEYADFINSLAGIGEAITVRYPYGGEGDYRFEIFRAGAVRVALAPMRACNWLAWNDGAAFAWWAGLRPMTELEFEKACRGSAPAISGEYAWGNTKLVRSRIIVDAGQGPSIVNGNANLNASELSFQGGAGNSGPVRDDAFCPPDLANTKQVFPPGRVCFGPGGTPAAETSLRGQTGATFWGVLGMTGNLWELGVSAGNDAGRAFTGIHGAGMLGLDGNPATLGPDNQPVPAQDTGWPDQEGNGVTFRGGSWYTGTQEGRVADRCFATSLPGYIYRSLDSGMRAVRTAPATED